ncbi:helix-turn-helix domain-containing protein [Sinomicrobium sp. M5D2P9]
MDKDRSKQSRAYGFLSSISELQISEKYADSAIAMAASISDYEQLINGHFKKARVLRDMGRRKRALDELLKINQLAIENNDFHQQLNVKYTIGILKNDIGEFDDALKTFKEYVSYTEALYKKDKKNSRIYSIGLMALGDSYNRNKKYDSAITVLKKGRLLALNNKNTINSAYFTQLGGVSTYYQKNYKAAIDSVQRGTDTILKLGDVNNGTVGYLFLGKIYKDNDQQAEAARYFTKVDSMVQNHNVNFPEIREAYEFLIDFYKENGNSRKQLEHVDRLMRIDTTLQNNYKYLTKNIVQKYDTSELISEKNQLIQILHDEKKTFRIGLILLLGLVVITSGLTYNYYRKQRVYRKKYQMLFNEKSSGRKLKPKKIKTQKIEGLNISETTVHHISQKLEQFVEEKQFLKNDISVTNLAKAMNTNPKYLTSIIKFYEQKNFSTYINDLRVNYIIEELKNNPSLRKYSVKAIAYEVGFNNTQSFSKAFHKETGIYPSYYIQELEKEELNR